MIVVNAVISFLFVAKSIAGDSTYVQVEQGLLAGQILDLVTGEGQYHSFKGIPYAQPPEGELRFKAPIAASAWDGVRNAKEHGSVCPQKDILTNVFIPGDEDCLFLNVYSPNVTSDACLPVLFFIHGGGFKSGSGNVDSFGPDFFMRKYIVLVTINYRLDALGFLSLGTEEVPGNAGLKDQVLALKWVQQNIKYFGGDPTKVTIMGQSAGGASVGFHLASPMSTGLFHRAIALSGSPYCDWAISYRPEMRAFKLGKQLGFETRDKDALLTFLQSVTSDKLVLYTNPHVLASEEITSVVTKSYIFSPLVEEYCGENSFMTKNLFDNYHDLNEADILFGYTNEEGTTAISLIAHLLMPRYDAYVENFASRKVSEKFEPDIVLDVGSKIRDHYFGNKSINMDAMKEFITYINDASFKYDIVRFYLQIPNNGKKYMYQFSSESSRNEYGSQGAQYGIFGAGHIDDLSNLFDPKSRNLTLDMNSNEFQIIDRFTTLIANFVKFGNPTPNSSFKVSWPEFNARSMKYMDIGTNKLSILSLRNETFYKFWLKLHESVGVFY
ncbi:esterase B1-like [Anticarsia gemmatalis]|uniref:esterase B1-like n=1 Tax=Anticarsia gemmatalis TaxID=129554 RepID=UPI003F774643